MKTKNTLLLLLVALGIFGFIYFIENKMPTSAESAERAGRVVQFNRDKINAITIRNTETVIELRKDKDGTWVMEKPLHDRADAMAVNQLFTTAESLRSEARASDEKGTTKDQLKEFGVANSETRVKFEGDEKPVELLFGKDAAVENRIYVRLENSNVVHVIGTDLKSQVTKKADEFRDHNLTGVTATQVNKAIVKTEAGEMELLRKDQHWMLVRPLKARGDDQKIGDLVSQVANARADSFVADGANLTAYGLQEPRGIVTLFSEGSDKPAVVQIGSATEKDKEKVYVKVAARDAVTVVPKTIEGFLASKPNDLRDRNLIRVEEDIVDRMTVDGNGREKIVLARKGESWVRKVADKDEPINAAAAVRLLAELKSQRVTDFVSDVGTDLAKYGLDQPQVKVTLSSYSSENTAETKAGERPILTVLFGKSENGNVFAKLDEEPFIVSVPAAVLNFAMTDPLQWQDLAIFKNKADEITTMEIMREGHPTLTLARDKDRKWILAKGDGKVNQTNVDSLVNTLSSLRAVRWVGATVPAHGFDKPAVVVTFDTGGGAKGRLTVGTASPDEMRFAIAEGLKGTFEISRPDFTALELPLIDRPAENPKPAAAGTPPAPDAPPPSAPEK
jgi:hypothetical protein